MAPKNDALLASGGGDAIINIWHDCTEADEAEEEEKHQVPIVFGHGHSVAAALYLFRPQSGCENME